MSLEAAVAAPPGQAATEAGARPQVHLEGNPAANRLYEMDVADWPATNEGSMNLKMVPKPVRKALHPATRRIRRAALVRTLRAVAAESDRRLPTRSEVQTILVKWSNGTGAADETTMLEVARLCRGADGPILECGSGATTFLAAIYARHGCWALENYAPFRRQVADILHRSGLEAHPLEAPLIDYGDFDWYRVPSSLPDRFAGVVCDGPAGTTRGGRSGLLPIMGERLKGATILLDDADRDGEQATLQMWANRFGVHLVSTAGRAALLEVPETQGS